MQQKNHFIGEKIKFWLKIQIKMYLSVATVILAQKYLPEVKQTLSTTQLDSPAKVAAEEKKYLHNGKSEHLPLDLGSRLSTRRPISSRVRAPISIHSLGMARLIAINEERDTRKERAHGQSPFERTSNMPTGLTMLNYYRTRERAYDFGPFLCAQCTCDICRFFRGRRRPLLGRV